MTTLPTEIENNRQPDHEINPQFLTRWSPRSFKEQEVPENVLLSLFEAARWSPSGSNLQPWRFIIARSIEERAKFHPFIAAGNREWCEKAPVLAVLVSHTKTANGNTNPSHAFDAGTSWGYLALEAANQGLITHAMGGFDRQQAREALGVPEDYDIHAVIAIGYRGPIDALADKFQEREVPSNRQPLDSFLFAAEFGKTLKNEK
ncbi:nitroreductase family protein [Paenibacillus sp. SYP-B3998]|uniref:Nitroreductase family protein n=1 Tax=Paenibacillus sp. SYP-B3998 TaxID=2678564 RepID=A0A6G3ZXQ5_9BACL|nr:nitroreductase family protein [Paenibacillus sp. SYP-B3998]NEW06474.1 nitroreductase family protein [Paenibacillus sp. SYP-B3998]